MRRLACGIRKIVTRNLYIVNCVLAMAAGAIAHSQENSSDSLSPLRVVQKYSSGEHWPDKFKYFCCEMAAEWRTDSTLGEVLPKRVQRTCTLVFQDSAHAGVDLWLEDSAISKNYYFYLNKQKVWTVFAVRTLADLDSLRQEELALDTMSAKKMKQLSPSGFTWQFEYDNIALWSDPDTLLCTNFRRCESDFNDLQAALTKKGWYGKNDSLINTAMRNRKIRKSAAELLIRDIHYSKRYPGSVFYIIGGSGDNSVGYMYQPDPAKVPHMTEKHFILMMNLGDGWYLFKTT